MKKTGRVRPPVGRRFARLGATPGQGRGLFNGAAVVNVNGQRKLLRVGQRLDDVEVVSADPQQAVLRIDGRTQAFTLDREYSDGYSAPQRREFSVPRSNNGHYQVTANVNGRPVSLLVDTAPPASP